MIFTAQIGNASSLTLDRWVMHAHLTGMLLATLDRPELVAAQQSADQILDSASKARPGEVVIETLDNGMELTVWSGGMR